MRYYFSCFLAATVMCLQVKAQTIRPANIAWLDTPLGAGVVYFGGTLDSALAKVGRKCQSIYWPSDFPTTPEGQMTNLYFQLANGKYHSGPSTYNNLTVKIGPTNRTQYKSRSLVRDTFIATLIKVFDRTTYAMSNTDSAKNWIKIPMDLGGFGFTRNTNFAVEITCGTPYPTNGIDLAVYRTLTPRTYRYLQGGKDSIGAFVQGSTVALAFGFDIATVGIEGIKNITSLGLFPNPSTDGRFMLSLMPKAAVRKTVVTATTLTGQRVWSREYDGSGTSFFKELDMSSLPKGTYALRVEADGEVLNRMVIIQ